MIDCSSDHPGVSQDQFLPVNFQQCDLCTMLCFWAQKGLEILHVHLQRDHVIPLWFPHPLGGKGISQSQHIHSIFERNQPPMANLCIQMIFVNIVEILKMAAEASAPWWGRNVVL